MEAGDIAKHYHCGESCKACLEEGRKAGIKEVVEWMNAREKLGYLSHCGFAYLWQAKLKEWGIDSEV